MCGATVELVKMLRRSTMTVHSFPEVIGKVPVEDLLKRMNDLVSKGTAFAVTPDRFVTCYHVIKNLDPKKLKLSGAPDYTTGLPPNIQNVLEIVADRELDIALLKTERVQGEIVPITLEAGVPQVGLDILAVGYPLPEQKAPEIIENEKRVNVNLVLTFRALRGIIASRIADGVHFEIDKQVNHGQSGGPVVSIESGKLVGMCQAYRYLKTEKGDMLMLTDLSVCLNADAILRKLKDWEVSIE